MDCNPYKLIGGAYQRSLYRGFLLSKQIFQLIYTRPFPTFDNLINYCFILTDQQGSQHLHIYLFGSLYFFSMNDFSNLSPWMLLSYLILFQLPLKHLGPLLLLNINSIQFLVLYQDLFVSFIDALFFNLFRLFIPFGLTWNEGNLVVDMQWDMLPSDALLKRLNRLDGIGTPTVDRQLGRLAVGVGHMVASNHKLLRRRRQIVAAFSLCVAEVKLLLLCGLSTRLCELGSVQLFDSHFVQVDAVGLVRILADNLPFGRARRPASDALNVLQASAYSQFRLSSHEFKFQQQRVSDQMCLCPFKCLFKLCSQLSYILVFFA